MILQQWYVYILLAYLLISIISIEYFKDNAPTIYKFRKLRVRIFFIFIALLFCSFLCSSIIKHCENYGLETIIVLSVLKILFDIVGLIFFGIYCYKDRGITIIFPFFLLSKGIDRTERLILKKVISGKDRSTRVSQL